jgi:uncharacterized protein YrrD
MLRSTLHIHGFTLHATDGDIGTVDDMLFDDIAWTIRYLVVKTGNWLNERQVLLTPISFKDIDWENRHVTVNLTRQQVKDSPDITADMPVSRQQEIDLFTYYNYPFYWEGSGIWGTTMYPTPMIPAGAIQREMEVPTEEERAQDETNERPTLMETRSQDDPHLRSVREVTGYRIEARDGRLGHVETFVFDEYTWSVRYVVIDTNNWLPGKKVVVSPHVISHIEWAETKVIVDLPQETIKQAPEYGSFPAVSDDEQAGTEREAHTGATVGTTAGVLAGVVFTIPSSAIGVVIGGLAGGIAGNVAGYAGEKAVEKVKE